LGIDVLSMWIYDGIYIFLNMPKNKTPKKKFKSSDEVTKEINKVWKKHKEKEKGNGMV